MSVVAAPVAQPQRPAAGVRSEQSGESRGEVLIPAGEDGAGGMQVGDIMRALQSMGMFVPALNDSYSEMVAAQQGINPEELMLRLLQDSSYSTAKPASKYFLEHLKPRTLVPRDFLQLYFRFHGLRGLERDVFPTVATFGAAGKFLDEHAEAQAEEKAAQSAAAQVAEAAKQAAVSSGGEASAASVASPEVPATVSSSAAAAASEPAAIKLPAGPREHLTCPVVLSNPSTLAPPLRNGSSMRGSWVLADRGVTSFVAKAREAQNHMARGLIVLQTEPDEKAWPFVPSDTTGKGSDIIVPVCMISQTDGAMLKTALAHHAAKAPGGTAVGAASAASASASASAAPRAVTATLLTRERPLACCVCREDFELGGEAVELPCHHFFDFACIEPWLKSRSQCPLCRFQLPVDGPKQTDPAGPDSNQAQLQRDMFT
jgi:hypothetical protein